MLEAGNNNCIKVTFTGMLIFSCLHMLVNYYTGLVFFLSYQELKYQDKV